MRDAPSVLKITINRKSTKSTRSHDTHVEVRANRRGEYDVPAILVEGCLGIKRSMEIKKRNE